MTKIEIRRWDNNKLIICGEYESVRDCLEKNKSKSFYRANLRYADLSYANLSSADLSYADLRSANLSSANLSSANLRSANLRSAKYIPQSYINLCSRDILFILSHLKKEVPFLREKLIKGEVDGTQYEGKCSCLIGSLDNADGGIEKVCAAIPFYEKGLDNYGEQWFFQIHKGDTSKNSFFAKHALLLIDSVLGEENAVEQIKIKEK